MTDTLVGDLQLESSLKPMARDNGNFFSSLIPLWALCVLTLSQNYNEIMVDFTIVKQKALSQGDLQATKITFGEKSLTLIFSLFINIPMSFTGKDYPLI